MRFLKILFGCLGIIGLISYGLAAVDQKIAPQTAQTTPVIGILVPAPLAAMQEIVNGFKETLTNQYGAPVKFIVSNAQNDINLQRTMLQAFDQKRVNIVVPIGTDATEMAIALIKDRPIVALGAQYSEAQRRKDLPQPITNISDEVSPQEQIDFIHRALPQLTHITIIHSADDKIFKQVDLIKQAARINQIDLQDLMINQLADLYNVSQRINPNTQAIFVLKDELVISGINTLIQTAIKKHIILITSDQGSVEDGATFALGVAEKEIGVEGARLAQLVLMGVPATQIPVKRLDNYYLFINNTANQQQGKLSINRLTQTALMSGYKIIFINKNK